MKAGALLYQRALAKRAKRLKPRAMSTRALLALCELLERAGWPQSLVTVRAWPRFVQGETYLWALAIVENRADGAPPPWQQLRTLTKRP